MLTPQLAAQTPPFINALRQKELCLRGRQITDIANIGAATDVVALDLSANAITDLTQFPRLPRLKTLNISRNRIQHTDTSLDTQFPNLEIIMLDGNYIHSLKELDFLTGLRRIEFASFADNPVVSHSHYRLYTIWRHPRIRVLDYERVNESERAQAAGLFGTLERPSKLVAEVIEGAEVAPVETSTHLSAEYKEELRDKLAAASSLEEIDKIEAALRAAT